MLSTASERHDTSIIVRRAIQSGKLSALNLICPYHDGVRPESISL